MQHYELKCDKALCGALVEAFVNDLTVMKSDQNTVWVEVKCIPSVMREWVLAHGS